MRLRFSLLIVVLSSAAQAADAPARVDYLRDVKPILEASCTGCHGAKKQEAGLRLDLRDRALRGGDSGPAIVPGKSGEGELFARVTSSDDALRMPPPKSGVKPLDAAAIAKIKSWIDQGASWPDDPSVSDPRKHWAYQPLKKLQPPDVRDNSWCRSGIDRFVLATIESRGVAPSKEADRRTLIRRLSYDLVGLPPDPSDVEAFLADRSPSGYASLVDRLLASPAFGERWGRDWLDKARYADSDGYEKDNPRPDAWRYRDWTIAAINADLPFDQFTIEQLAGDLLPGATDMQKLATAFHRQTLTNTEGGTDQEQWRVEAVFDRVNTTGTVWLGLTVGCAQCHSHKYDAISHREYYQLFAFYNNGDEAVADVPTSEADVRQYELAKQAHNQKIAALQLPLAARAGVIQPQRAAWEREAKADWQALASQPPTFQASKPMKIKANVPIALQPDGDALAGPKAKPVDAYHVLLNPSARTIHGLRLRALTDPSLPGNGPGRSATGNFVLSEIEIAAFDPKTKQTRPIAIRAARADFAQDGFPVAAACDGKTSTGWAISPQEGKPHEAVFGFAQPLRLAAGELLQVKLDQQHGLKHTLGRFRIETLTSRDVELEYPAALRAILDTPSEKRSAGQQAELADALAQRDGEYAALKRSLAELEKSAPRPPLMSARVIAQRVKEPRKAHILHRGDFLQPQKEVIPATLDALPPMEKTSAPTAQRLDLARWLVSPANPLTPRVTVNQVWTRLFGQALVRTPNDFGVRGEKPTHPELLDWLAAEFIRRGWSRKALIREIVMSSAYRQSSAVRPDLAEFDPENRLIHRQNRFRVEAETLRDVTLSAAGLLQRKLGGPSVFPPMPADVAALSYAGNFKWTASTGYDRYRRGMYTFFKRTAPHPSLTLFDCPDGITTAVARSTSNTPLQALATLNNDSIIDASRGLASRATGLAADDSQRIDAMLRISVGRSATPEEAQSFRELLDETRTWYASHLDEAADLAGVDAAQKKAAPERAAWMIVARVILNLDEFLTRE